MGNDVCACIRTHILIYIYIYIEREREWDTLVLDSLASNVPYTSSMSVKSETDRLDPAPEDVFLLTCIYRSSEIY